MTDTSHTPAGPGASSCTTSLGRDDDVTVRVQWSSALDTFAASTAGAWNGAPSIRAINASPRSVAVLALGGSAGSSMRSTLSLTIASTTAVITAVVVARPSPQPIAATVAGIAAASATIAGLSTSAGLHRTAASTSRPCGRCGTRRLGTIDPPTASRTPSIATCPSQSTLAPTPAWPWPPPSATSQPSASFTGIARRVGTHAAGQGDAGMVCQPSGGPPIASRRADSSAFDSGVVARPPPRPPPDRRPRRPAVPPHRARDPRPGCEVVVRKVVVRSSFGGR